MMAPITATTTPARQTFKNIADVWASGSTRCTTPTYFSSTMRISNIVFDAPAVPFRRVHVEYAATTPRDIEIVHSVAYPETTYEVPILGIDVVTVAGVPKFAICDLTMPGFSLAYWNTLAFDLQGKYDLVSNRAVPDWAWIFSDSCLCIKNPDIDAFGAYVAELTETYAAVAALFPSNHDYHACHKAYCEAQRQNAKTRGMLTASFSAEFADKYMRFMFDV